MSHLTCDLHGRRVVVLEGGRVLHRSGRVVVRTATPNGGEGDVEIAGNVCKTKTVSIGDAKGLPPKGWDLSVPADRASLSLAATHLLDEITKKVK